MVFSAQWEPSVDAFRLVAGGAIAGTMTAVIRTALNAAGQSGTAFRAVPRLAVTLVAFPVGIVLGGVTGGGFAFLVGSVVGLAVHAWTARTLVAISWTGILRVGAMGAAAALWRRAGRVAAGPRGARVSGLAYDASSAPWPSSWSGPFFGCCGQGCGRTVASSRNAPDHPSATGEGGRGCPAAP